MTWLYEDAWTIIYGGAACVIVLTIVLLQVGRGTALIGLLISSLVVGALLLVERSIVTEKERVEETLTAVAEALEANDVALLFEYLDNSDPKLRKSAEGYMKIVRVELVRIGSDLKIVVNELTSPPSATATFTCRIKFSSGSPFPNDVAKYSLTLNRKDNQWKIFSYQRSPVGGL